MNIKCLLILLSFLLANNGAIAKEKKSFSINEVFDEQISNLPELSKPERGTVSGTLSSEGSLNQDLTKGSFSYPIPIDYPHLRGSILLPVTPSYNLSGGLTEFGQGFGISGLTITRFQAKGDIRFNDEDEWSSPWGKLHKGGDGFWYPYSILNSKDKVRLLINDNENYVIAYLPDGTLYFYYKENTIINNRNKKSYSFYISEIVTPKGEHQSFHYLKNESGKYFLDSTSYGGRVQYPSIAKTKEGIPSLKIIRPHQYQIHFSYKLIDDKNFLYSEAKSGQIQTLDRYVSSMNSSILSDNNHDFILKEKIHFNYTHDNLTGIIFYLTTFTKTSYHPKTGEEKKEPPIAFDYYHWDKDQMTADKWHELSQYSNLPDKEIISFLSWFSQDKTYILDTQNSGRPTFESRKTHTKFWMDDDLKLRVKERPSIIDDLKVKDNCLDDRTRHHFIYLTGIENNPQFVKLLPDGSRESVLKVCNKEGFFETALNLPWHAKSEETLFADINNNGRPDIITFKSGKIKILKNTSQGSTLSFDDSTETKELNKLTDKAYSHFFIDLFGQGTKSIVAKYDDRLKIWQGFGNYQFDDEHVKYISFLSLKGREVNSLNNYEMAFIDINKNGLTDVLLFNKAQFRVFLNYGDIFKEINFDGISILKDFSSFYPSIENLSGSGNSQLNILSKSHKKVFNLELTQPETGLLKSINDGKGNLLTFKYKKTPHSSGNGDRLTVLDKTILSAPFIGETKKKFNYKNLRRNIETNEILGFDEINIFYDKVASTNLIFQNPLLTPSQLIKRSDTDYVNIGHIQNTNLSYQDGELLPQKILDNIGFKPSDFSLINTIYSEKSQKEFLSYDDNFCLKKTKEITPLGTLEKTYSYDNLPMIPSDFFFYCPVKGQEIKGFGENGDHFNYTQEILRNSVGLPTDFNLISEKGEKRPIQKVSYTPETYHIEKVETKTQGDSFYQYDDKGRLIHIHDDLGKNINVTYLANSDLVKKYQNHEEKSSFTYGAFGRLTQVFDQENQSPSISHLYEFSSDEAFGLIKTTQMSFSEEKTLFTSFESNLFSSQGDSISKIVPTKDGIALFSENTIFYRGIQRKDQIQDIVLDELDHETYRKIDFIGKKLDSSLKIGQEFLSLSGISPEESELVTTNNQMVKKNKLSHHIKNDEYKVETSINGDFFESKSYLHIPKWDAQLDFMKFLGLQNTTIFQKEYTIGKNLTYQFYHDALGRFIFAKFPSGQTIEQFYDDFSSIAGIKFRDFNITYERDKQSGLVTKKEIKHQSYENSAHYQYDKAGRVTHIDLGENHYCEMAYNDRGLIKYEKNNHYLREYDYRYDGALEERKTIILAKDSRHVFSEEFKYSNDSHQNILSKTIKSPEEAMRIQYGYDHFGRINEISFFKDDKKTSDQISLSYNLNNKLQSVTIGGVKTKLEYDEITLKWLGMNQTGFSFTQKYDDKNRIEYQKINLNEKERSKIFNYSDEDFLVSEKQDESIESFQYDEDALIKGEIPNTQFDPAGRLIASGNIHFKYGPNGRLAKSLIKENGSNRSIEYFYDHQNELIFQSKSDELNRVNFSDGVKWSKEYGLIIPIVVNNKTVALLTKDGIIRTLTDHRDTLIFTEGEEHLFNISAYGDYSNRNLSPILENTSYKKALEGLYYASKNIDLETGLVNMGKRHYFPKIKRFTTPDPFFMENPEKCIESPVECNLYSYAKNNPVSYVDPTGEYNLAEFFTGLSMHYGEQKVANTVKSIETGIKDVAQKSIVYGAVGSSAIIATAAAPVMAPKVVALATAATIEANSTLIGVGMYVARNPEKVESIISNSVSVINDMFFEGWGQPPGSPTNLYESTRVLIDLGIKIKDDYVQR